MTGPEGALRAFSILRISHAEIPNFAGEKSAPPTTD